MKKENTNQPNQPLTNEQFIEAHMVFEKNVNDQWTGRFVCADGYSVSFAAFGSIRSAAGAWIRAFIVVTHMLFQHCSHTFGSLSEPLRNSSGFKPLPLQIHGFIQFFLFPSLLSRDEIAALAVNVIPENISHRSVG